MEHNQVTFFIVSNHSGKTRKLVLPVAWIKIGVFVGSLLLLVGIAAMLDYSGLLLETLENKKLKSQNAVLTQQFQVVESKVSALESSLERINTFTAKLKLITNIDANDRVLQLSVAGKNSGAQSAMQEYEPIEDRPPMENLQAQDQAFQNKPFLNSKKGELSQEKSTQDYSTLVIRIDKAVKETTLKEQSVIELWESLADRQSLLRATPNIKPARGWITSRFGKRINPVTGILALHAGLDIAATPGSPVYAPADGVVTFASYDDSYGKLVSIDHGYGVSTRFGHNSQIFVHVGQKVSKYDVISAVGSTGRSTGPHLHYEVRINGSPVDPANYILDE